MPRKQVLSAIVVVILVMLASWGLGTQHPHMLSCQDFSISGSFAVLRDVDMLGRIFDTFGLARLRPEAALMFPKPQIRHLRTRAGRQEVDLVIELSGGPGRGFAPALCKTWRMVAADSSQNLPGEESGRAWASEGVRAGSDSGIRSTTVSCRCGGSA